MGWARASKDLDGAYRGSLDEAVAMTREAISEGWQDFSGAVTEPEEITRAGLPTAPIRFKVKLRYKGKDFVTIPLEWSVGEGGSLAEIETTAPSMDLGRVQLRGPDSVPLLPLRYQIAQKLHACTENTGLESPNQRARDLHDLLLMEELGLSHEMLPAVRAACVEIFSGRSKHDWPPTVVSWRGWGAIWTRLIEDEGLDYQLSEAVERVQQLVTRSTERRTKAPSGPVRTRPLAEGRRGRSARTKRHEGSPRSNGGRPSEGRRTAG